MKRPLLLAAALALTGCEAIEPYSPIRVKPRILGIGNKIPTPFLADSRGDRIKLEDLVGKYIVLEWYDPKCAYSKKFYDSSRVPNLQNVYASNGVAWYVVLPPGVDVADAGAALQKAGSNPTAILLDPRGEAYKKFKVERVPSVFVADNEGVLRYYGAFDDNPTTEPGDAASLQKYVENALDLHMQGKKVAVARTQAYGCPVRVDKGEASE